MTRTLIGSFLCIFFAGFGVAEDTKKKNPLVGTYTIAKGARNGHEIPNYEIKDVVVQIADNAITTFDRDKKMIYAATYKLNKKTKPWTIHLTATLAPEGKGTKSTGLIAKKGKMVKVIYNLPGGKPPKDFKTRAQQQMFVLKPKKTK